MGRWSEQDEDSSRLPHGFRRVGYDADTQVYTYRDAHGKIYEGEPGNRYGVLRPAGTSNEPEFPTAAAYLAAYKDGRLGYLPDDAGGSITAAEKPAAPAQSLTGSSRGSTSAAPNALADPVPQDVADFLSSASPSAQARSEAARPRSGSSAALAQIPALARSLTRRLTQRIKPERPEAEMRERDGPKAAGGDGGQRGWRKPAAAPRRTQTVREYVAHGPDGKKDPPRMWQKDEGETSAQPALKRRGTR